MMDVPSDRLDRAVDRSFDWIDEALDALSARGLIIDLEQRTRVVALLLRLSASGSEPSHAEIGRLLTPILASSPDEQRICLEVFESILSGSRPNRLRPADHETTSYKEPMSTVTLAGFPHSLVRNIAFGLGLLVLGSLVYLLSQRLFSSTLIPPEMAVQTSGTSIPALQFDWLRDYPIEELEPPRQAPWNRSLRWFYTEYSPAKWLALLVPWLLVGALVYWAYIHFMAQLRREAMRESLRTHEWPLSAGKFRFGDRRLISQLQPLRKLARVHVRVFDVEQTALASAAAGGLLQPRYQSRPVTTDFVALIDRQSTRDHLAEFNRIVCQVLTDAGLNVEVLEFDRDPSLCRIPRTGEFLRLKSAISRFSDAILLIFADATQLVEPSTGRLLPAVQSLCIGRRAILMTPHSHGGRSILEASLNRRLGLIVLRTTPEEMGQMVHVLLSNERRSKTVRSNIGLQIDPDDPLINFIAERPERWSQSVRPNSKDLTTLRRLLRNSLGARSMTWLGATTVYPELRWLLTLSLRSTVGRSKMPKGSVDTELLGLCQLPWFRRGWMPLWVRDLVQQTLTKVEREAVRQSILATIGFARKCTSHQSESLDVHLPTKPKVPFDQIKTDRVTIKYLLPAMLRSPLELPIPASWAARIAPRARRRLAILAGAGILGSASLSVLALSLLPIDECDLLAASSVDALRIGPGRYHNVVQIFYSAHASQACDQASKREPNNGRYLYQFARSIAHDDPIRSHKVGFDAANLGYPAGMNSVGYDYLFGEGVNVVDLDQAEHYLQMAVDRGNFGSYYNLAIIAERRGDKQRRFEMLKKLFNMGGVNISDFAMIYNNGDLVRKDERKYLELLRIGAARGDGQSAKILGWEYDVGLLRGARNSIIRANEFYRLAIRLGADPVAAHNLAINYSNGAGVEQSYERATYWYIFAAKQNFTPSLVELAKLMDREKAVFAKEHGPKKDFHARLLFGAAARSGDANAEYEYAKWLENKADDSYNGEAYRAEALNFYRKAAVQGHEDSAKALQRLGIKSERR